MHTFKSLLVISILLLVGCAAKFDNNEYRLVTSLRFTAQEGQLFCGSTDILPIISKIHSDGKFLVLYSEPLPHNEESVAIYKKIQADINDMMSEYILAAKLEMLPSRTYCKLKLKQIETSLAKVHPIIAKRPR